MNELMVYSQMDLFLGIAEMLNIYSATCSTQLNIQKVIITGQ